jgi:fucose 4-O-acetylase-like acetyltransferase
MQSIQKKYDDRILFLDNIRYLMVLLVVVLHAACSYSNYTRWWVVDDANSRFFDGLLRILGVFLMPTLFFIAGYFALPSLHKRKTWFFIKHKFKRLGVPWLIGVILLGPIHKYIYNYSRNPDFVYGLDLWSIFLVKMKSALSFNTGFIYSNLQFNHLHFWFLSLLLLFFIVFALLHKGKRKLFANSFSLETSKAPSNKSILSILFLTSIISTVLTLHMYKIFSQGSGNEPWIIIGSLIQFQPTRVILYIFCFTLGIYAFHKKWFIIGNIPGHFVFWTILSVALWFGQEKTLSILLENFSPIAAVFYIFIRTLLFFSILLTFISFGEKFWDSSSKVNMSLAENSYNIYIIHMIFVFLVQLLLLNWLDLSIYIKFIIVSLSAIFLSYISSRYAIKRFPRLAVAGMIGIFAMLLVYV